LRAAQRFGSSLSCDVPCVFLVGDWRRTEQPSGPVAYTPDPVVCAAPPTPWFFLPPSMDPTPERCGAFFFLRYAFPQYLCPTVVGPPPPTIRPERSLLLFMPSPRYMSLSPPQPFLPALIRLVKSPGVGILASYVVVLSGHRLRPPRSFPEDHRLDHVLPIEYLSSVCPFFGASFEPIRPKDDFWRGCLPMICVSFFFVFVFFFVCRAMGETFAQPHVNP